MAEASDKVAVLRQLIAKRDRLNRAIAALMEKKIAYRQRLRWARHRAEQKKKKAK
jgi:hypothetical protein